MKSVSLWNDIASPSCITPGVYTVNRLESVSRSVSSNIIFLLLSINKLFRVVLIISTGI